MKNEKAPFYLAFLAFVGELYEAFLLRFQYERPSAFILYPAMCDLITELPTKFVRKKYLYESDNNQSLRDVSELISLEMYQEKKY